MVVIAAVEEGSGAHRVVARASELADAFEEELHVIHVGDQYESTEQIRRSSQTNVGEEIDTDNPKRIAKGVAEKIASEISEGFTAIGLVGYPGQEILNYADNVGASYIVIGGRKRSPVGKALFGSVAQEVVLGADRPVVTVRVENID